MDIFAPPSGRGPGVLVAHPWWGLNQTIRDYAAALAAEGFVVGVPDLFEGDLVTTPDEAQKLIETHWEQALPRLTESLNALAVHPSIEGVHIGAVGFSFGGFHLLRLASEADLPLRALVAYYATYALTTPHVPVLAHLAAEDAFESGEDMAALARTLEADGPPNAAFTYPGTAHWFAEANRPEYDSTAAHTAFQRTTAFLRDRLTPGSAAN